MMSLSDTSEVTAYPRCGVTDQRQGLALSHHPSGYYVIDNNTARAYNTKEPYLVYAL